MKPVGECIEAFDGALVGFDGFKFFAEVSPVGFVDVYVSAVAIIVANIDTLTCVAV